MDQNQVINVLIAAELLADGEQLVNLLRKAGFSLHAEAVSDTTALRDGLQQRRWDLLLHLPGNASLQASQVCVLLEDQELDIALVLIGDPGRSYLPRNKLEKLGEYRVEVTRDLEDAEIKLTSVWRLSRYC